MSQYNGQPPRPMPIAPPLRKPHLYLSGAWFCSDGNWLGWGASPAQAYKNWRSRNTVMSCVHHVPTVMQRRREKQLRATLSERIRTSCR
jgi:hypothetical protein